MVQGNITPDELTVAQDQLLSAGSKISFRDIYNQQIELPLYKKKFYKADDVDATFILINGVLTDVSKHAHRTGKALAEARKEAIDHQEIAEEAVSHVERLSADNESLRNMVGHLQQQLDSLITKQLSAPSDDVLETQRDTIEILKSQVSTLESELDNERATVARLKDDNGKLSGRVEELQSANQLLMTSNRSVEESSNTVRNEMVALQTKVETLESEKEVLTAKLRQAGAQILRLRQG